MEGISSPATPRTVTARILLVDDHTLVLDGLSKLLKNHTFEVVAVASSGQEGVELAVRYRPDLVLIDISMPGMNGFETARKLKEQIPEQKIIALTMHNNANGVLEARRAGMAGYLSKGCSTTELLTAIQMVLSDQFYATPLLDSQNDGVEEVSDKDKKELTDRQKEVLRLIAKGHIAKEIAGSLGISVQTAEFHRVSIMQKLNLHTTAELTRYAIESHIVEN